MTHRVSITVLLVLLTAGVVSAQSDNPIVLMETSMGTITLELYPKKAPASVKNFLHYVDTGHYDGTIFHRVIKNFMIQGGGYTKIGSEQRTGPPIKNESKNGLSNKRGTIAVARAAAPDSGTAQFYINTKDNPFLNGTPGKFGYAVFGKVVAGMRVVDKIRNVKTGQRRAQGRVGGNVVPMQMLDVPVTDIVIRRVRRRGNLSQYYEPGYDDL